MQKHVFTFHLYMCMHYSLIKGRIFCIASMRAEESPAASYILPSNQKILFPDPISFSFLFGNRALEQENVQVPHGSCLPSL